MTQTIRIGNAQAFWGDRPSAAVDLLSQAPDLDFLTMDYLAEVSMSILAVQRERDPQRGFPQDFVEVVRRLADYWAAGGRCRLIANAGGLNPMACAAACQRALEEQGCPSITIGIVTGDDVLDLVKADDGRSTAFLNLDDSRPMALVQDRLVTANAYMGCRGIRDALDGGAQLVITGRVADPSLVVGACAHAFGWSLDDWERLAGATVAGHLLECGTHVTGGIATDWLDVSDPANIGFPIAEIDADGSCVITKAQSAGGCVTVDTVREQLIYEIGDPGCYLSPDVSVSFLELSVREETTNRVSVSGAKGSPRPDHLKVSATYRDGYRAAGMLTVFGHDAIRKARRSGEIVLKRLADAGWTYRDAVVECLGTGDSVPVLDESIRNWKSYETVLRIAVESEDKRAVEAFSREIIPLVTAGPQGTTGYAEGRPKVHAIFRYWPCLVSEAWITQKIETKLSSDTTGKRNHAAQWPPTPVVKRTVASTEGTSEEYPRALATAETLRDIAIGRSGDKGIGANIGILARSPEYYSGLVEWLTEDRVQGFFEPMGVESVTRFLMPNLGGMNFLVRGILRRALRNDAQGKALAQALLSMPLIDFPELC